MYICRACAKSASSNLLRRLPAAENRLPAPTRAFATSSISQRYRDNDFGELEAAAETQAVSQGEKGKKRHTDLEKLKRATRKELQHTTDPYHIAENVQKKLREKDFEKALMLVREASKDKQVVVSWNHLIEYEFQRNKLQAAIKLYNEMKKRAQLPNAQTSTIIFKGCAASVHAKLAVGEALKIYNAMMASSRLKPNTIHLNAVLDVCARAQDLESMFVVLRTAGGIRAPNTLTYTIILNALRHQRSNEVNPNQDLKEQQRAVKASIETTIARAKLVWDEAVTRWKKNEITIDEELMCAMGRILLLGGARETDAVLNVVVEVLGMSKLRDGAPAVINPDKQTLEKAEKPQRPDYFEEARGLEKLSEAKGAKEDAEEYSSERPKQVTKEQEQDQKQQQQQQQQQIPSKIPVATIRMAGNNTLSLIMRALAQDKRTKLAARYWDYMTHTYEIVPDRRNYRDYLDCLSTGASSGKAARVLLSMPDTIAEGNLYRRGLLMCFFDAFNDKAFENATIIYDAMVKKLQVPDVRCMRMYLQVSMSSYRKFLDTTKFPTEEKGSRAHGQQMFAALDRVWEPLRRATNDLSYSDSTVLSRSPQEAWTRNSADREAIMEVAKSFVATSDKILAQGLIPKTHDDHRVAVTRRRVMQAYIDRWMGKDKKFWQGRNHQHRRGRRPREDQDLNAAAG